MLPSPMRALCRGPKDRSPDELHLAVLTGRTKRIKNLLRKGVHIESVNSHGQTPLFCASFGGDNEVVTLLLKLGANPNRRCGTNGASPVHGAAYRGSRRVLRLLVEAGGDLTQEDHLEQTPRDYALKQPSPIRRQKILHFLDLLLAMTLHQSLSRTTTTQGTLPHNNTLTLKPTKSMLSLAKREGSIANLWSACLNESGDPSPRTPYVGSSSTNLHKTVSCHLLDQMYVSTSLPLLSPVDLQRPDVTAVAYTCGGPTVYSPYTWLGTNVTVRRPTPALTLPRENVPKGEDKSSPDQGACKSLVQELSVLRRLRHPAFLEVMAVCHVSSPQPEHLTLVFQNVPYGSLYHHLHVQHRDLSVGGAVDILVGLVEAMLFLHAHGWLHTAISSHSLHLVTANHAKLGGFEFALEMQGKGCSMKAPQLIHATWLHPWQAPETLSEQMVSVRSEIYAFSAIMWEIWSGMPPWSGVEEGEITRRVGGGETLPDVSGSPPSLVTYLTQYGLKWNAHERELDLQEIHTMLRSLRIQSNEEDRVPLIPAWGPPSIPNTPVIGRHTSQNSAQNSSNSDSGQSVVDANNEASSRKSSSGSVTSQRCVSPDQLFKSPGKYPVRKDSSSATRMLVAGEIHPEKPSTYLNRPYQEGLGVKRVPEGIQKSANIPKEDQVDAIGPKVTHHVMEKARGKTVGVDSGFSTPCTRTPSPVIDTMTSAKMNPSFLTSTPSRQTTTPSVLRCDLQPDLLPNKVNIKALRNGQTPDILSRAYPDCSRGHCREEDMEKSRSVSPFHPAMSPIVPVTDSDHDPSRTSSPSDEDRGSGYSYISNAAKRAFLMESDGGDDGSFIALERPASASKLEHNQLQMQASHAMRRTEVIRRGLSMTNINSAPFSTSTSVTRTTSHISLSSASSSASSDICGRKPVRTVSQITLTLRKLSQVSDSSSSKDDVNDHQFEQQSRARRSRSVPKSPAQSTRSGKKEGSRGWDEITGIKPASHQLTRHSSSCSLASGPSSPTHQPGKSSRPSHLTVSGVSTRPSPAHASLPRTANSYPKQPAVGRRWSSISGTSAGLADTAVKIQPRRHSEGQRSRPRKNRRRPEVEVEEEFFDDEFNAQLFHQPHMQLSVGSSENLLDSRAPHSMLADGSASPVSLGLSSFSPSLTSSEDEDEGVDKKETNLGGNGMVRRRLGAVVENGNSEEEEEGKQALSKEKRKENSITSENEHTSDNDSVCGPWRVKEFGKDYEPLKSVELLRNLEKNLSMYLPTYSIGSDTESGEP